MANCENNCKDAGALKNQKQIFNQFLSKCLKDYPQTRHRPFPVFIEEGRRVDLYQLGTRVRDLGGYHVVSERHLWASIAADDMGLHPSCGPTLKLVFTKYLKLAERWLRRVGTGSSRGLILGGRNGCSDISEQWDPLNKATSLDGGEEKKKAKRKNDMLTGMVDCIKTIAKSPGTELNGWWEEQCVRRAKRARGVLFDKMDPHTPHPQKKQKIHPIRNEERMKTKKEDLERQITTQTCIPVYDFPLPLTSSSHVASFLPEVLPLSSMSAYIQTGEDIQQHSPKLPSICNISAGYKYTFKEHIPRKRVRIGSEFQAEIPAWNSTSESSIVQSENEDSSSNHLYGSRWLLTPIWPMKVSEEVANEERIGKGRSDRCACAVQGSIECVRLHVEEEREKLKEELGYAFSAWRFDDMGETVSKTWSTEEECKFWAMVRLNPASLEKNFWNRLPTCLPSKKTEDLVSYYFNVFVLRRRGKQNRAVPYNIDSDDDESEVGFGDNAEEQVMNHTGSKNTVNTLKCNHSGINSGSQACGTSSPNFNLKIFPTTGEDALMLPHLEDHNCIDVQQQDGMLSLSYSLGHLRKLQEKDFQGVIPVENL